MVQAMFFVRSREMNAQEQTRPVWMQRFGTLNIDFAVYAVADLFDSIVIYLLSSLRRELRIESEAIVAHAAISRWQ